MRRSQSTFLTCFILFLFYSVSDFLTLRTRFILRFSKSQIVAPHLNGANAVKVQWIGNSLAQKENGKRNATRDEKTSKAETVDWLFYFSCCSITGASKLDHWPYCLPEGWRPSPATIEASD